MTSILPDQNAATEAGPERHALAYRVWLVGCTKCGWAPENTYLREDAALAAAEVHDIEAHGAVMA